MPTAELRLQYPNHAFNSCKVVVHCTKTAPVHARGVQWIVAFPWIQEAVVTARKAVFFALLALIAACANTGIYDEPYALVEGGTRSAVRKELPAFINAVDGRTTFSRRYYPTPVKPGKHVLDVYFGLADGASYKQYRRIELDAAECTRYRIVAHYGNLTHVEWGPAIYPEPIGECVARFAQKTAQN